jgi:hypothetical protein
MLGLLYIVEIPACASDTENVNENPETIVTQSQNENTENNDTETNNTPTEETGNTTQNEVSADQATVNIPDEPVALADVVPESPRSAITITDLPNDVQKYCEIAAAEFSVDPNILKALVYTESRGNYTAKNGNFIGLTQLKPKFFTATIDELNITDPYDPYQNVRICAYSLANWMIKYNDTALALDCWHKGEKGAVSTHTAKGTYYSRTIMQNAQLLASL